MTLFFILGGLAPVANTFFNKQDAFVSTVYAFPKSSSGGFKSGSFSSPKSSFSKFKSGSFSNSTKKSFGNTFGKIFKNSGNKGYTSSRHIFIPIPIFHSHYYGGGIIGSAVGSIFRFVIVIIIIIVIIKIINKSRRY